MTLIYSWGLGAEIGLNRPLFYLNHLVVSYWSSVVGHMLIHQLVPLTLKMIADLKTEKEVDLETIWKPTVRNTQCPFSISMTLYEIPRAIAHKALWQDPWKKWAECSVWLNELKNRMSITYMSRDRLQYPVFHLTTQKMGWL